MGYSLLSAFYFNLLQDVNILRPLIYLLSDDLEISPTIIVSQDFLTLDSQGIWIKEIKEIAEETNSDVIYQSSLHQIWLYTGQFYSGFIVSASESDLPAHRNSHEIFKVIPKNITKITLQHGYECVGFLMNKNHQDKSGSSVSFNADVIVGWLPAEYQYNLRPLQYSRYVSIGSPTHIEFTSKRLLRNEDHSISVVNKECGIVCENLHSARHDNVRGDSFLTQIHALAAMLNQKNEKLAIRPHPSGQYVLKNKIVLPDNVFIDNRPSYKIDWQKYRYGISAPSSILIDFLSFDLPCLVWQDIDRTIDISSFNFLPIAHTQDQLFDFTQGITKQNIRLNKPVSLLLSNKELTHYRYARFFEKIYINSSNSQP